MIVKGAGDDYIIQERKCQATRVVVSALLTDVFQVDLTERKMRSAERRIKSRQNFHSDHNIYQSKLIESGNELIEFRKAKSAWPLLRRALVS